MTQSSNSIEPNNLLSINKTPIVAVLIVGSIIAILNQTLLTTAIPHIMLDLGITENTAQWVNTGFMLVNGIMIPVTAFLIETFTTRNLFFGAMALFILGTVIAIISPSFSALLIGRMFQAAGAGILFPLTQTILLVIYPIEKRGQIMGTVGLVVAFAPAMGPVISGYLVDYFSWRAIFYVLLVIGIADVIAGWFILKNVIKRTFPKMDMLSIGLSTIGFGGILYGFSIAGSNGWLSSHVLISIPIGIAALLWFVLRQLKLEQPILELRVFKHPIFTISVVIVTINFAALIASETILPLYMQNMLGYSALKSGMVIFPGAILMGLVNPIAGAIFDRIGAKRLSITGLALVTITTFFFTRLSTETTLTYLVIFYALRMAGLALIIMPLTTAGLNKLNLKLIPHGTSVNNTVRQIGASIGTAMLITIMINAASGAASSNTISNSIHGVNVAFWVATVLSFATAILALFINDSRKKESNVKDVNG